MELLVTGWVSTCVSAKRSTTASCPTRRRPFRMIGFVSPHHERT